VLKTLFMSLLVAGIAWAGPAAGFLAEAKRHHGASGEKAASFVVEHMPEKDQQALTADFLTNNLDLAFRARAEFPWAAKVPEEIFLNDVLPYAVFDETREPWRADFLAKARPLVKEAKSASEAAQALNRGFFNLINVHYHTGRKAPNQSPAESVKTGRATCTGLSIILVNACRAVGIPARAVGTPMWSNGRGNHTWVEIWDGGWHFTGADEYDAKGLNRGWFTGDAAQAKAEIPEHAIYATSWKKAGLAFPMVWAAGSGEVAAVNVTDRYRMPDAGAAMARLGVRLWDENGGKRLVATVRLTDGPPMETLAGKADHNDMPRFERPPESNGRLFFTFGNETRELAVGPLQAGDATVDAVWKDLTKSSEGITALLSWLDTPAGVRAAEDPKLRIPLSREDAATAVGLLGNARMARLATERKDEVEAKSITHAGKTLRWLEKTFGEAPADGRSLWISLHGGGGAPAEVNDSQWQNQILLYQPAEGIYIAPRAPTNTWNLWHEGHIDPLFQRLIEGQIALRGVNPNKIYLMGYSAGGDGVWQLAPRMADRFAAAAMMAGHPNEASLLGLRNLPFALFMGAKDAAHNRNGVAAERSAELARLAKADPGAYVHFVRIYDDLGHWMNGKDAEALPWMAGFTRDPWPKKIVWLQDDITHDRFYWLKIPDKSATKAGAKITATVDGQTLRLDGELPPQSELRLSDQLIDPDREITVILNGREILKTTVPRTAAAIHQSLEERADPPAAATAVLVLP
jgi:hypothetical protein